MAAAFCTHQRQAHIRFVVGAYMCGYVLRKAPAVDRLTRNARARQLITTQFPFLWEKCIL